VSETGSARVRFVDLLRVAAAFQMVQGHALDAVLATETRLGPVHAAWTWTRGLTAVAFLFVAGVSFHLSTVRRYDAHRRDARAVARRLRRAGGLVLFGYALHLPVALAWTRAPADAADVLGRFVAVDVLQCVGMSLIALEVMACALPSRRTFLWACGAVAGGILLATPAGRALVPQGASAPLVHYLSPLGGSVFPLLPWAAHVFLGVVAGAWIDVPAPRARAVHLVAFGAVTLGVVALARVANPPGVVLDHIARLGSVVLCAAPLALVRDDAPLPAWVTVLAGETLFVYASHVLLVYGDGIGLATVVGPRLSLGPALLVAAGVIVATFSLALRYRGILGRLRLAAAPTPG
jgi:uncharacterized membrane protein